MKSKKGNHMKKLLAVFLLCLPRLALAAGTVTSSVQAINQGGTAYIVTINWTGDASTGSVPTTTIGGLGPVQGMTITQIQTVPGSPSPTAGYSITVKDARGYDMAEGQATTLSATVPASFATTSAVPPVVGALTFALTGNSVASAKGQVVLYIFKPAVLAAANLLGRYGSGGGGSGDVVGPGSSTDNALARFDGTTGKLLQNSAFTVDDSGNASTSGTLAGTGGISSGSSPPTCAAGTAGVWCGTEGTAPTGESGVGELYWKTDHLLYANPNNGGEVQVPTASSAATFTNKTFDTAGTGNSFMINGTSITAVSGSGAVCLASGSACSGGGSSYRTTIGKGSAVTMTGSDVALFTVTSVPALASGACYMLRFGLLNSAGAWATNGLRLKVDGTAIQTLASSAGASGQYEWFELSYCNDQSSQTAQTLIPIASQFCDGSCPGGFATNFWQTYGFLAVSNTPTAVNWASSHDVTITGNVGSGTVTPLFLELY